MAETFNVGDVVRLKSGRPRMTIVRIGEDFKDRPEVSCTWFDGAEVKSHSFSPEALEIAGDDPGPVIA